MGKKELGLGRFSATRRLSEKVKGKSDFTTEDAENAEIGRGEVLKILRRTELVLNGPRVKPQVMALGSSRSFTSLSRKRPSLKARMR
jgi:hypothetical protein